MIRLFSFCLIIIFSPFFTKAQESASACKVLLKNIAMSYTGECKKGYAHGTGEAKGIHRYAGSFKNGMPNGKGTYHFSDSIYYTGNFQEGLKEGKGEMHYMLLNGTDSIVKGYWSGDVFRGTNYVTYSLIESGFFDRFEVIPSNESGNTITIETSSTTGAPNSETSITGGSGYVVALDNLIALDASFIRETNRYVGGNKISVTYELSAFPVKLRAMLSNRQHFTIELYKAARWTIRIFINK